MIKSKLLISLCIASFLPLVTSCSFQPISPEVEARNIKWEAFYESYKKQHPDATESEVLCATNREFGSLRSCPITYIDPDTAYDQQQDLQGSQFP